VRRATPTGALYASKPFELDNGVIYKVKSAAFGGRFGCCAACGDGRAHVSGPAMPVEQRWVRERYSRP
jgi:hypothetical protein